MREGLHKIVSAEETIVALSTPLGRSAIGVVRLSGLLARPITNQFFRSSKPLIHRTARVGYLTDSRGGVLDEVVVTLFEGPKSYTGEDLIEISAHGNPVILSSIIQLFTGAGARLAVAGEFTLRAVLNGKMDLIQAEAVREFIEAQTEQQARTALQQMSGVLSKRLAPVKERLVGLIALLEAGIDFAEDDVDEVAPGLISHTVAEMAGTLRVIHDSFGYGRILAEGFRLTILGKPNVGKSLLFNRLLEHDRAIVTGIPGTTRDTLTEVMDIQGIPVRLSDTAGIREALDEVERLGIARSIDALCSSDLALVVLDGSAGIDDDDRQVLARSSKGPRLIVVNKQDLPQRINTADLEGPVIRISATLGTGVNELRERIADFLQLQKIGAADDIVLTNARQAGLLGKAMECLMSALTAVECEAPHEMLLLDLYGALSSLNEISGDVVTEDILDRIFSTFCIGK